MGRWAKDARVFGRLQGTYLEGAFCLSPFYALHVRRADEGLYRLRDIAPDALQRSSFFVEYFGQTRIIDEVAFTVWLGEGVSLNLFLGRDGQSACLFTGPEIVACRRIAPIVAAVLRAHWPQPKTEAVPPEDTPGRLATSAARSLGVGLSPRQAQVALLILRGHSTLSIAMTLQLSSQTVKVFRKQLYARCGISSQGELFSMMLPLLQAEGQSTVSSPALGRGSVGTVPVAR